MPVVSDRRGVDLSWFQTKSSQGFVNSEEVSVSTTPRLAFWRKDSLQTSRIWCCPDFARITPTAHRWCNCDSFSPLRTLWSAVITYPNCVARGMALRIRGPRKMREWIVVPSKNLFEGLAGKCGGSVLEIVPQHCQLIQSLLLPVLPWMAWDSLSCRRDCSLPCNYPPRLFRFPNGFFFFMDKVALAHHVKRCAWVYSQLFFFMADSCPRSLSCNSLRFEKGILVFWYVPRILHIMLRSSHAATRVFTKLSRLLMQIHVCVGRSDREHFWALAG